MINKPWYEDEVTIEDEDKNLEEGEEGVQSPVVLETFPALTELVPELDTPEKRHILVLAAPLYNEIVAITRDLKYKREGASYGTLINAIDKLMDKVLLLSGGATARTEVILSPERREHIRDILVESKR